MSPETASAPRLHALHASKTYQKAVPTSVSAPLGYGALMKRWLFQTISDGTDHIDPASLRGCGPDQVLVLVNGKRFHNSALVNINGTGGGGGHRFEHDSDRQPQAH